MESISATDPTAAPPRPVEGPKGIGGWLILPLIHLVGTVVLTGINLVTALQYWDGLLLLATGQADPSVQWMALPMLASLAFGVAVIAFALYLLIQFFQKKRAVPRLMIWFYVLVLATTLVDSGVILAYEEFQESPSDVEQSIKDIGRSIVAAVIWIPYFLVSKRVKATFVE